MNISHYSDAAHDGFVYGSWLAGHRDSPMWCEQSADVYYPYQRALIRDLLKRSTCLVADDDGVLSGFAVVERQGNVCVLHWAGVKKVYREEGLARLLVQGCLAELKRSAEDDLAFTHLRPPFSGYFEAGGWMYRPGLLGRREKKRR